MDFGDYILRLNIQDIEVLALSKKYHSQIRRDIIRPLAKVVLTPPNPPLVRGGKMPSL